MTLDFVKIWTALVLVLCQLRSDIYVNGVKCYNCHSTDSPGCANAGSMPLKDDCDFCRKIYQEAYKESGAYVVRECLRKIERGTIEDLSPGCEVVQILHSITRSVCVCNNADMCNQGHSVTRPHSALYWACALGSLLIFVAF